MRERCTDTDGAQIFLLTDIRFFEFLSQGKCWEGKLQSRWIALAACLTVVGCAASSISTPSQDPHVGIPYRLAEGYYLVELEASELELKLIIRGPYVSANTEEKLKLKWDVAYNSSSAVAYELDVHPNGLPQGLSLATDSRALEIAAAAGGLLGTVFGVGGDAPGSVKSPTVDTDSAGQQGSPSPPTSRIFSGVWWPNRTLNARGENCADNSPDCFWDDVNEYATYWLNTYEQNSRVYGGRLITFSTTPRARTKDVENIGHCSAYLCFSQLVAINTNLVFGAIDPRNAQAVEGSVAPSRIPRAINFVDYAPSPVAISFMELKISGLSNAGYRMIFTQGMPSALAFTDDSDLEVALGVPVQFITGVLQSFVDIIPLRLYVDIRRRELTNAIRGEDTAASQYSYTGPIPSTGGNPSAPNLSDKSKDSTNETITAITREYIVYQRHVGKSDSDDDQVSTASNDNQQSADPNKPPGLRN